MRTHVRTLMVVTISLAMGFVPTDARAQEANLIAGMVWSTRRSRGWTRRAIPRSLSTLRDTTAKNTRGCREGPRELGR